MNKIEFGIDLNKDGHCDLCGKFVDINGQHNNSKNLEQIIKENVSTSNGYKSSFVNINKNKYFSSDEKDAIFEYCRNHPCEYKSSPSINSYLRLNKNKVTSIEKQIKLLDSAIENFETNDNFRVFRSFSLNYSDQGLYKKLINLEEKGITADNICLIDEGYLSTTTKIETALRYSKKTLLQSDLTVIMDLYIGKGSKCVPVQNYKELQTFKNDFEILFGRKQKIYVMDFIIIKYKSKKIFILKGVI